MEIDRRQSIRQVQRTAAGLRAIGLAPGDFIVSVNGSEVRSTRELNSAVIRGAERSSIVLSVARGRYIYNLTFPMGL